MDSVGPGDLALEKEDSESAGRRLLVSSTPSTPEWGGRDDPGVVVAGGTRG